MAAVIKAINAKIRSNKVTDYLCSTRTYPRSISSPSFPQASRPEIGCMTRQTWDKGIAWVKTVEAVMENYTASSGKLVSRLF